MLKEDSVVNNTIEGADLTIKGTADSFISINTDNEIVVPSAVNVVLSNTNHEKNYELSFEEIIQKLVFDIPEVADKGAAAFKNGILRHIKNFCLIKNIF